MFPPRAVPLALAVASLLSLVCGALPAFASDTVTPEPAPSAALRSPAWAALQLLPSSDIVTWNGTTRYGARWQVTPLLYSFRGNRKLSRWQSLAVAPTMRVAGSVELYVSPEVLTGSFVHGSDRVILRGGVRSYFPVLDVGEQLSVSLGASAFEVSGKPGAAMDVGAQTFGGTFGVRLGYSPTPGLRMTNITLELRIF